MADLLGQLLIGWLLADLLTAAFHCWEDRHHNLVHAPIIGALIIRPNILHHEQPLAFTQTSFWNRNGASIVVAGLVATGLSTLLGLHPWIVTMAFGGALSNEVHRYAHQPSQAPGWYRVLQQTGIVQSAKGHATHHRPAFNTNFCILTDWLNPILEAVNFWRSR